MNVKEIDISAYDYPLPAERIAKHPLAERDSCLLLVSQPSGELSTRRFTDLPELLPSDSMLVYNNTRVINARLRFRKAASATSEGALIEIFCLEPEQPRDYAQSFAATSGCSWTCLVGNSKKWKQGDLILPLLVDGQAVNLTASRTSVGSPCTVHFSWDAADISFAEIIRVAGEIPIPPYLDRATEDTDNTDYQTVYSHIDGSVAAPTAGLHFTDRVLKEIADRGIPSMEVTLHVGAGTFQPVKADTIGGHEMHSEFFAVDRPVIEALAAEERRVIAVGTTSVRTLESLYHLGCLLSEGDASSEAPLSVPQWYPYSPTHPRLSVTESMQAILSHLDATGAPSIIASTKLIIAPGYTPAVVKGMVTNFHQPRSTLLLLVDAFMGGSWRRLYDYALQGTFRFLSYGDACLLL